MNKNGMNGIFCHVVFTAKKDAMQVEYIFNYEKNRKNPYYKNFHSIFVIRVFICKEITTKGMLKE